MSTLTLLQEALRLMEDKKSAMDLFSGKWAPEGWRRSPHGELDIDYAGSQLVGSRIKEGQDGVLTIRGKMAFATTPGGISGGSGVYYRESILIDRWMDENPGGQQDLLDALDAMVKKNRTKLMRRIVKWFKLRKAPSVFDMFGVKGYDWDEYTFGEWKPGGVSFGKAHMVGSHRPQPYVPFEVDVVFTATPKAPAAVEKRFKDMSNRELDAYIDRYSHMNPEDYYMDGELQNPLSYWRRHLKGMSVREQERFIQALERGY